MGPKSTWHEETMWSMGCEEGPEPDKDERRSLQRIVRRAIQGRDRSLTWRAERIPPRSFVHHLFVFPWRFLWTPGMRRDPLTKLAVEEPQDGWIWCSLSASQRLSRSDHGSRRSGVRVFPILDPSAGSSPDSGKRELVALSKEKIARRSGVGRADEGSYALL
jgi:hypothetical protein